MEESHRGAGRSAKAISRLLLVQAALLLRFLCRADAVDWPTLGFTPLVTNTFSAPTCVTHAGDNSGRMFVVQQSGFISIIQSNSVLPQPFLDIRGRVLSAGAEQGLLGLAFPPGYATNSHFYVDYTRQTDGAIVISRFFLTGDPNVADTNSEQIIKVITKPYNNHNAGQLAFGPDGYLYIGVGDGGSEGDPQNYGQRTSTLLGKLLRIDVESGASPYAIPPNNPFVGNPAYLPEIWALGLRNPWRFSFDRLTGDLYVADVGQNLFEEIDFQPAGDPGGENYGWRIVEGPTNYIVPPGFTNFSALTPPVAWYDHRSLPTDLAAAVVGGYVYRGPSQPRMDGMYFYGDFMVGWIWGLKRAGTNWQSLVLFQPTNGTTTLQVSTFGEDDAGNLYLADYYKGKIYQVGDTRQVRKPAFFPTNGTIFSNLVTVSCTTTGAVIHYTTNGLDPTASDPVIASGGLLQVTTAVTNKLRAFRDDLSQSDVAIGVFTNKVGTPFFMPPAGGVPLGTAINISTVTPAATIYYTTNGANPTTNSLLYTGPLLFTNSITLRALGVETGYSNSAVASAAYTQAQVAVPTFTPASGPITNGTIISISCATSNAVIYYTLDGSTPTTNSAVYLGPLTINGGTTVAAFATATGYVNSATRSVFYSLVQTATPVFNPASGPITNGTPITITCATPGSSIYFTTDGSTPTTNSQVYSVPVVINGGTTLNAYAVADQHLDSAVQSVFYQLVQTATPVFNPASGPITNGTSVTISCPTPGATIYYTLDGSVPTTNSAVYANPLIINGNTTLNAFATSNQHLDSAVQSVFYNLVPASAPVFSPPQGPLTNHSFISITSATANATIRYTIDGSDPTTNSPVYLSPLSFTNPITLKAQTFRSDLNPSSVQATFFTMIDWIPSVVTTYAGGLTSGYSNAVGTLARFYHPEDVAIDKSGNLYVADTGNNVIREILPSGQVTTFAGTGIAGSQTGAATNAQFSAPVSVCVDAAGNVYVADQGDNRVCKIGTNGIVTNLATLSTGNLWQMSVDSATNVYVGSSGTVQKILPNGTVVGVAGVMNYTCSDGWCVYVGAGVDPSTNVYAATRYWIWQITPAGSTTVYAGGGQGFDDGPLATSQFIGPQKVVFDVTTNMFVSDQGWIRKIRPDGWVSTLAGTGAAAYRNGPGFQAEFNYAVGLCVDANENIYVADYSDNCIRKISPDTAGIGIADDWQLANFGYIGIDPNADPDHDGMSNFEEFRAGTDPLDPNSVLAINSKSLLTNGMITISWQSVAGKGYVVRYSTDLINWNDLAAAVTGDGTILSVTDPTPVAQSGQRFYRIFLSSF